MTHLFVGLVFHKIKAIKWSQCSRWTKPTNQPPAEAADPTCVNTKLLGHVKIADFARTIPVLIQKVTNEMFAQSHISGYNLIHESFQPVFFMELSLWSLSCPVYF